jgi:hypothetical protein
MMNLREVSNVCRLPGEKIVNERQWVGEQTSSSDYRALIAKLDSLRSELKTILGNNDFPMPDQFDAYQNIANELMDEMKKRMPRLMEDSDFFTTIFVEPAA